MKTFTQTSSQIRKKLFEMDNEVARETSAKNYLQKLYEFNIKSITELNEDELKDFIKSLRVIEG
jgi:hypothetical protein